MRTWQCRCCGLDLGELPMHYGAPAPALWYTIPEAERAERAGHRAGRLGRSTSGRNGGSAGEQSAPRDHVMASMTGRQQAACQARCLETIRFEWGGRQNIALCGRRVS